MKTICLFNHKGGVSKTTTSFHLGWALAIRGKRVLLADLDPQCNLTGLVMGEEKIDDGELESLYQKEGACTMMAIADACSTMRESPSDFVQKLQGEPLETGNPNLSCIAGHMSLSELDAQIAVALKIHVGVPATERVPGYFAQAIRELGIRYGADYMIYDLSPSIGALNEVALMTSDYFIIPAAPDFFCLQAVKTLSKKLPEWKRELAEYAKCEKSKSECKQLGSAPSFLGVIFQNYRPRNNRPAKAFQLWMDKILQETESSLIPSLIENGFMDKNEMSCVTLARIPDFNSLIAKSQDCSKPVYELADEDLAAVGAVREIMIEKRDSFKTIFNDMADTVISRTYV